MTRNDGTITYGPDGVWYNAVLQSAWRKSIKGAQDAQRASSLALRPHPLRVAAEARAAANAQPIAAGAWSVRPDIYDGMEKHGPLMPPRDARDTVSLPRWGESTRRPVSAARGASASANRDGAVQGQSSSSTHGARSISSQPGRWQARLCATQLERGVHSAGGIASTDLAWAKFDGWLARARRASRPCPHGRFRDRMNGRVGWGIWNGCC